MSKIKVLPPITRKQAEDLEALVPLDKRGITIYFNKETRQLEVRVDTKTYKVVLEDTKS